MRTVERDAEMHCQHQPFEQTPHLAPALTAVTLCVVVMAGFWFYARSLEYRLIRALAADEAIIERNGKLAPVKNQGTALQQAALETGCLLPIYGSSELNLQAVYNRPFHATNLFHDQPTGFTVFPVGKAETTCLLILQKLAAVGPALEGRKVAVSLSPYWFFDRLTARADAYAGNFSALHAGELAFNMRLSLPLRQDAARRMLQYPATLANRPLLRFALENMADGSPWSLACYQAVFPLGIVHNSILRNVDHWSVVYYLWKHPPKTLPPISPRSGRPLNWPMLHQQADASYRAHSNNNEFGLDNEKWDGKFRQETLRLRNTRSEEVFLRTLQNNQEWVDLELLLKELTELGAQPLLLSMPIHGGWYDQCGITYSARRTYYQELRAIGARYHAAVVDFADHDADRSFCHDNWGHPAPNGLVYYSQVLDGFFHDAIPRQPELPALASVASRLTEPGLPSRPAVESRPPSEGFHKPSLATAIENRAFRTNREPTLQGRKGKP
jgi:D-alanine transfer protein